MDWTGYPINLPLDELVDDLDALALFIGDGTASYEGDLLRLFARAAAEELTTDTDRLSMAYPREMVAYRTWRGMLPIPTAAGLLDALMQVPDTPVDTPVELISIVADKIQVVATPATSSAFLTIRHRMDTTQPWRTSQYTVPTPAVDIDPALLQTTTGAVLSVRLTVQDDE